MKSSPPWFLNHKSSMERAPGPTAVGGGYIQFRPPYWMTYSPPTAVGPGTLSRVPVLVLRNWSRMTNHLLCWTFSGEITISPGRPKILWPGDREAVEAGQHLGNWWVACHVFLDFFSYTMQQPRFAAQHSVIVRGTWCPTTNLTIIMTVMKFNLDSMGQATMMAPYVNKVSSTTSEWNDETRSHVLPPHGLTP